LSAILVGFLFIFFVYFYAHVRVLKREKIRNKTYLRPWKGS